MNWPIGLGRRLPVGLCVAAGLVALYFLWGSTFLAIRITVESLPPFLAAAVRWTIAGVLLYGFMRAMGTPRAPLRAWGQAALMSVAMIVASNGLVTWAETRVPSGLAALAIATVGPWMVTLDWLRPGGTRPRPIVFVAVALGLLGVGVLWDPFAADQHVDAIGMLALTIAALAFAIGSIASRGLQTGVPSLQFIGMQMLCGGGLLALVGLVVGEPWHLRFDVGIAPYAALLYLALAGSLAGFTIYAWLLKVAPPAVVGTYACVNPIVAVALGAWLADEAVTWRTAVAGALVVSSVAVIAVVRLNETQSTWLTGLRNRLGWMGAPAARSP